MRNLLHPLQDPRRLIADLGVGVLLGGLEQPDRRRPEQFQFLTGLDAVVEEIAAKLLDEALNLALIGVGDGPQFEVADELGAVGGGEPGGLECILVADLGSRVEGRASSGHSRLSQGLSDQQLFLGGSRNQSDDQRQGCEEKA